MPFMIDKKRKRAYVKSAREMGVKVGEWIRRANVRCRDYGDRRRNNLCIQLATLVRGMAHCRAGVCLSDCLFQYRVAALPAQCRGIDVDRQALLANGLEQS